MKLPWWVFPAVVIASGVFALALALVTQIMSPIIALALPVVVIGAAAIVRFPFLGLFLVAIFTQLDALAQMLFSSLPVSGIKALTGLTLVGVAVNSYAEPRRDRWGPDDPIIRLGVLFGIILMVSALFADDWGRAFRSLQRFLSMLVLLYLTVRLTTTEDRFRALVLAFVFSSGFSAVIVMYDSFFGGNLLSADAAATTAQWSDVSRSAGASNYNPTTAASMLLTGTLFALMLLVRKDRWWWVMLPTVILGTAGVVLSYARSSALALGCCIVWLFWKLRNDRRLPIALAVAALAAACALPFVPESYWERLATLLDFDTDRTLWERFAWNVIGVRLFATHPIIGVGPGNFPPEMAQMDYRFVPGQTLIPRQLHNMYLEVATELGLLGFGLFVGILGVALRCVHRACISRGTGKLPLYAEALQFGFAAFLIVGIFMPSEDHKYTWLMCGMCAAAGRLAARAGEGEVSRAAAGPSG